MAQCDQCDAPAAFAYEYPETAGGMRGLACVKHRTAVELQGQALGATVTFSDLRRVEAPPDPALVILRLNAALELAHINNADMAAKVDALHVENERLELATEMMRRELEQMKAKLEKTGKLARWHPRASKAQLDELEREKDTMREGPSSVVEGQP